MLDFVNWFFSFMASFVDFLTRCQVVGDVSLGMLLCSAALFLIVGRFLVGYWKDKSIGG